MYMHYLTSHFQVYHSSPLTAELTAFVAVDTRLSTTEEAAKDNDVLGFLTLLRSSKSGLFMPAGKPPGPYCQGN